jgi:hypothetical protein
MPYELGTLLYQFKSLKRLGQPLQIDFRVPPPCWGRLICRHVAPGAWWLHCSASYCWGGLLCCDMTLDPLWPLGFTSPLKRAPVPLHGFGLVVAPWICLPAKARFRATTWLRAHGAAPWLCLPTEVGSQAATKLRTRGGSLTRPPYWGRLPCRHTSLGPWWLLASVSLLRQAPKPPCGFGPVVAPWFCLTADTVL